MSFDLRPRRRSRPAVGIAGAGEVVPFARRGVCSGGISQNFNIAIGSSIGQIEEAQPGGQNLLFNTFLPAGPAWINNGTSAFAQTPNFQWDAGFLPVTFTSNNGALDFVSQPAVVGLAGVTYIASGQFSVDSDFALANPSAVMRVSMRFTGGAAREDSIDFNPATGAILAASAGVQNVAITPFVSINTFFGQQLSIFTISFESALTPALTNAIEYRVYPRDTVGGVGQVVGGALQLELATQFQNFATAFIPTPIGGPRSRPVGTLPRQSVDGSIPSIPAQTTANYTYQPVIDNGTSFIIPTNGVVFSLSGAAVVGEWCYIKFTGTTNFTLTSLVGPLAMPGTPIGGASVKIPYDGATPAGGTGPYNVGAVMCISRGPGNGWDVFAVAASHGTLKFTANGNFTTPDSVTAVWVDGCGGGGGGGGTAAINAAASGGSAGLDARDAVLSTVPGTVYAVTIGAGGNGGVAGANNGADGTSMVMGALLTLAGGVHGVGAATGVVTTPGGQGGGWGGSGILTTLFNYGGAGGTNGYGGSGLAITAANPGGTAPGLAAPADNGGSGGGGAASGTVSGGVAAGGNGAAGSLVVRF